jgi:hypothetical protein
MTIWEQVSKSDPKYLKKVSFGARSFTSIDPMYQVREATRVFGAIGEGWGWESKMEQVHAQSGDIALLAHVSLWHGNKDNMFGPFSGCRTFYNASKQRFAEDAPKMAITDGLTKALSHLGFNADVFLGEHDNKYAADNQGVKGENWYE